ncbi:MAG TPA: SDR family NAD(P)-dependent oxidoreductase [Patescibacteria group bacterium]|nr:SDR family NAD(P)-dependent oxidoreductase [Patescibacteria group bacterium]
MKNPNSILITGASSGIGRALAILYAAPARRLLLTGRDAARLSDVAAECRAKGASAETCTVPVTEGAALKQQIEAWDDFAPIDLVIANAGISGGHGKIGDEAEALLREIMAINVDGMFNTVNPLISRMRRRRRGQIALLSSIAGFRGLPSAPAYSTSKNAVRAYGEALRPLLIQDNVGVSVIFPGFIRTPLTDKNDFDMPFMMDADNAARIIYAGLQKDRAVIAFPWQMRAIIMLITALPRCLGDAITARALKSKKA